ncbi:MAG: hypothetical protein H6895_13700 [Defluviimonas sp.]|uniref:hypothetical protein n=1 Tax=Albidovulum sp. TaxID=1872424 RepID=UPI001D714114|nr:hypothetical protein [Paracoccaceae bacterium]MCC0065117.1 hypothetical protein [Defluviimonas sp.]
MVKVVTLFLIGMLVLALFGRLRMPGRHRKARCPSCGRPLIGPGPCGCGARG